MDEVADVAATPASMIAVSSFVIVFISFPPGCRRQTGLEKIEFIRRRTSPVARRVM